MLPALNSPSTSPLTPLLSTPSKVVTEQATTSSKVIKGQGGDRAIITESKKRRIDSTAPPLKPSATPSTSTEQQTVMDKRADQSLGSTSKKISEVSKADAGSSTFNALLSRGHEKCRGGKKVTAGELQGKKKAGLGDKGGGSRGRGRPGRPVKRKGEALVDELGGTPGKAIVEEGDELGSEGSEYEEEEEEAYDPIEDEEFTDKKSGGKRGRKPGGAVTKRDVGKGKDKGETDAMVSGEDENEAEEGVKEGC